MIVHTRDGHKRELYGLFDSSTPIPRPSQWGATVSWSGERISVESAAGLPAFLRGLRLISETAASLPFVVYRGRGDKRRPVASAAQLDLFERPNPDAPSGFAVWQYLYACLPGCGNAYLWKVKTRRRGIVALYPLNPKCVEAKYDGDRVMFEIRDREYGPVVKEAGKDRVIHIPGVLLEDPYVGVSVVQAHRHSLGTELGRQRFEGRYLAQNGQPGVILKHPGNPKREQRDEVRDSFDARHAGQNAAGRTGMMWGGWDIENMPVTLTDAQFIESKRHSVQDVGRMLGIPSGLLNDPDAPGGDSPEQENMRLLQHGIAPWLTRVERALAADTDLFPQSGFSVEADERGLLRADIQTRFNAYRLGRQGGWITGNEIRAWEGMEPHPDGDEIQQTPVGGAVNNSSGGAATNNQGGSDADANDD